MHLASQFGSDSEFYSVGMLMCRPKAHVAKPNLAPLDWSPAMQGLASSHDPSRAAQQCGQHPLRDSLAPFLLPGEALCSSVALLNCTLLLLTYLYFRISQYEALPFVCISFEAV